MEILGESKCQVYSNKRHQYWHFNWNEVIQSTATMRGDSNQDWWPLSFSDPAWIINIWTSQRKWK